MNQQPSDPCDEASSVVPAESVNIEENIETDEDADDDMKRLL